MKNNKHACQLGATMLLTGALCMVSACGDKGDSDEVVETQKLAGSLTKDNINNESELNKFTRICHALEKECPSDKDAPCEMDSKIKKCIVSCPEIQNEETCEKTWYCRWKFVGYGSRCRRNDKVKIVGPSAKFGDNFIWGSQSQGF